MFRRDFAHNGRSGVKLYSQPGAFLRSAGAGEQEMLPGGAVMGVNKYALGRHGGIALAFA